LPLRSPLPGCQIPSHDALAQPEIVGALPDQDVLQLITEHPEGIRDCLRQALENGGLDNGQLVLRLAIAASGRVTRASVDADSTGSAEILRSCLSQAVKTLVFPRSSGVTWVCYPVNVALEKPAPGQPPATAGEAPEAAIP